MIGQEVSRGDQILGAPGAVSLLRDQLAGFTQKAGIAVDE